MKRIIVFLLVIISLSSFMVSANAIDTNSLPTVSITKIVPDLFEGSSDITEKVYCISFKAKNYTKNTVYLYLNNEIVYYGATSGKSLNELIKAKAGNYCAFIISENSVGKAETEKHYFKIDPDSIDNKYICFDDESTENDKEKIADKERKDINYFSIDWEYGDWANYKVTYTGKEIKPQVYKVFETEHITYGNANGGIDSSYDVNELATYKVEYKNNINVGKATVIITGTGNYKGTIKRYFTITKANQKFKTNIKKCTLYSKKLRLKKQTAKSLTIKNAKGTVKITKVKSGTTAKIYKKIKINSKTGAITFKKGKYAKKTYKIKLKITVSGNSTYKSKTLYKTVKVKVK